MASTDVTNTDFHLNPSDWFIGSKTRNILEECSERTKQQFIEKVKLSFISCGSYLQKKMPVDNLALKCISTIDPNAQGHSLSLKYMLQLAELTPNVIQLDEKDTFEMEVRTFHHSDIPPFSKEDQRIDEWWNLLRDAYPVLSKIVFAILSCFHGPQVESAFSIMQDILDSQSSRLCTETLSAIQTVKYTLRASNKSAVGYFKRSDVAYDHVDKKLSLNMRT